MGESNCAPSPDPTMAASGTTNGWAVMKIAGDVYAAEQK